MADNEIDHSASTRQLPGARIATDSRLALDGGVPVRSAPWPTYDRGAVCVYPEDEAAALRAIRSHLYFRYDYRPAHETECAGFEAELCRYFGCKHALATSSGTTALALAIMGAGIPLGSLIACPGFTFAATPSAILLAGCTPFLVDVDENLHLDVADLRRRWTPQVRAIMVVHMRGFAGDMAALLEFADEMGVPVFEDAVPALGAELAGRKLGTFGVAGAFSTQSDKSLNSGEGGFLVTDDSALFARATVLSGAYEGRLRRHFPDGEPPIATDLDLPLLSFRMDEIRAALLRAELARLPVRLAAFRRNYDHVAAALADVDGIRIRQPVAPGAYLGEAFIFRVPSGRAQWFARALCHEGIEARNLGSDADHNIRAFWNWRFLFRGMTTTAIQELLPAATRYLQGAVDIPLSSTLTPADCDELVTAVRKVAAAELGTEEGAGSAAAGLR
ncbi:DegT/DnrJ/EryC1/StrS family aminotransferase [Nocardia brasiliensis]|uniref:Cell wall biogenesis regulatory pyridoxal phosphate-dependent protein n=1 Tax=Nocardia brasiliensis (strain ATCC 700358 / HUJEG-1) TaxID=1133849 RepID=K0F2I0_NOCB7|nr:aminotransferase class I/II-fold pyridoxal phosphate-dependent enzyme [Nocardia brasiliensis]AFU01796.1 cell wall biogenesis regulatory pyridoxal phosphate-dependent protein [Nocardia brasiliensis ATCC 700358]